MPYKDPIKAKECKHKGYLKHRAEYLAASKRWNKEHPERRKEIMKVNNKRGKIRKRLWAENKRFNGNQTIIGKKCFICNGDYLLAIHHIDGQNGKQGKQLNNDSTNLIVLCVSCHAKVHSRWNNKNIYEYAKNQNPHG